MLRIIIWLVTVLLLGGCATTSYVPVPTPRLPPRPPAECLVADPSFPRVPLPKGATVVSPTDAAKWGLSARQWATVVSSRRVVCRAYAKHMQTWK